MTVKFHAFRTDRLARELSQGRPSEKVQFLYLLGTELLLAFLLYYSLIFGAYVDWMFFLEIPIVLLITFIGIYEAYRANGGANGNNFLIKAYCLLFPITVNVVIASEVLSWAYIYLTPFIADPAIFADPTRFLALIGFVWNPVFTVFIFWRLNVHILRIASAESPNKTSMDSPVNPH